MGRNVNTGSLTKQYILSKVSQVTIFSTYLNLSDNLVQHCIDTGEFILSPIRDDINPTCGFKYDSRGRLKFKDFAGYFWGDCFDMVAYIMSAMYNKEINISNKQDFIKVLRHVTLAFKDIFYGQERDINLITEINSTISSVKSQKPHIELVTRDWNEYDKTEWGKIGVTLPYLNINFIYPIDQYYINRKINPEPKYYYKITDPCYAYILGKDRSGIYNIKLYFPSRDKGITRFITNCNHLEGIYNLDRSDYDIICITKSTKDRASMGNTILDVKPLYGQDTVNIGVINIPHETYKLRQNEYDWLKSKLKEGGLIVSLMDNDRVGIIQAKWLRDNFKILALLIPKKYKAKDFAEYRYNRKINEVANLINDTVAYIKSYKGKYNGKRSKLIENTEEGDDMPF